MSSPGVTLPVDRAALAEVFKDPRTLLAIEALFKQVNSLGGVFTPGMMMDFGGGPAPTGWLECDGSAVGRADYPALFAITGTAWGAGDGSTTFNLPDARGRSLVGRSGAVPLGTMGGSASVSLSLSQIPAHDHPLTDPGHDHPLTDPGHHHDLPGNIDNNGPPTGFNLIAPPSANVQIDTASTTTSTTGVTVDMATTGITVGMAGSGDPVPIEPPFAAVLVCIKT